MSGSIRKPRSSLPMWVCTLGLIFQFAFTALANNRVLELSAAGDGVRLPSGMFAQLTDATVECWVKWHSFRYFGQVLLFGERGNSIGLNVWETLAQPQFYVYHEGQLASILTPGALRTGEWFHLALVMGREGMKLYVNGVLAGEHAYSGSFAALPANAPAGIGYPASCDNIAFHGQLDELRVWRTARTEEQICETLFQTLTGKEEDLLALWSFEDGAARDLGPHAYHGQLQGQAQVLSAALPTPDHFLRPAVIEGRISDAGGHPMPARVKVEANGTLLSIQEASRTGEYRLLIYPVENSFDLCAYEGKKGAWRTSLLLRPGERRHLDWTLPDAINVSGMVLALDDRPQPDALVHAIEVEPESSGRRPYFPVTARTDERGRYELLNLRPGTYRVLCVKGEAIQDDTVRQVSDLAQRVNRRLVGSRQTFQIENGSQFEHVDFQLPHGARRCRKRITTLDGLPDSTVRSIASDDAGYLWLGTLGGLARWDGERIVRYTTADGLCDNSITSLHAATNGVLWIGTRGGLSRFDGHRFKNYTTNQGLPHPRVNGVEPDQDGGLWLASDAGAVHLHDQRFVIYGLEDGLPRPVVGFLGLGQGGLPWFGTDSGIVQYDGHDFVPTHGEVNRRNVHTRAFHQTSRGDCWFSADHHLVRHDGTNDFWFQLDERMREVTAIFEINDGTLFFGTHYGVLEFDPKERHFRILDCAGDQFIYSLYETADGLLWIGTAGGLYGCEPDGSAHYDSGDGLADRSVTALAEGPEDCLWVGTSTGLTCFDGSQFHCVTHTNSLFQSGVRGIFVDSKGSGWFGTDKGIVRYRAGNGFDTVVSEPNCSSAGVQLIHGGPDAVVWNEGGQIFVCRLAQDEVTNLTPRLGFDWGYMEPRALRVTQSGILWLAHSMGLVSYDRAYSRQYHSTGGQPRDVAALFETSDGHLWIGTHDSGVWRRHDDRFTVYTLQDGLANNQVHAIEEDEDGLLWFGTGAGVSLFDGITWSTLDERDGVLGNHVNAVLRAQRGGGAMWFGTDQGLIKYQRGKRPPGVRISALEYDRRYNDLSALPKIVSGTRASLEYSAVDFRTRPERRQYRCALRRALPPPAEAEFRYATPTTSTRFEWQPGRSGIYDFAVQAIDRDLNYSEPARLRLTVVPPWYGNLWIAIPSGAGVLIALGSLFLFGKSYHQHRREARRWRELSLVQEREQALRTRFSRELLVSQEQERRRIARELHDSLGQNLLLIKNRTLLALDQSSNPAAMLHQIGEISQVCSLSIEEIREISYRLHPHQLDQLGLSEAIQAMADQVSASTGLAIEHHLESVEGLFDPDQSLTLYRLIQEAINNVVKHAHASMARIELRRDIKAVRVEISDNGRGFAAAQSCPIGPNSGLGLTSLAERAQILGAQCQIDSAVGQGTRVRITIPIPE